MDILMAKVTHFMMFAIAIWKISLIKYHMAVLGLITRR